MLGVVFRVAAWGFVGCSLAAKADNNMYHASDSHGVHLKLKEICYRSIARDHQRPACPRKKGGAANTYVKNVRRW